MNIPNTFKKETVKQTWHRPVFEVKIKIIRLGRSSFQAALLDHIPEGYTSEFLISANPTIFNKYDLIINGIYTILFTVQADMDREGKRPIIKYGLKEVIEGHNRQDLIDENQEEESDDIEEYEEYIN